MRLAALAAGLFLTLTGFAAAQPYESPEALLEAFYEPYFSGDFYEDETQFRSEALQALYDNDAEITPEGEMGAISFDPYIDGQDYEVTDLVIGTPAMDGDAATVEVSFKNFGQRRRLVYELVLEDGWKIDDVVSTSPDNLYRLSEIFAEAAAAY
ncbi:YqhG/Tai3 family protein [Devosia sp. A449]